MNLATTLALLATLAVPSAGEPESTTTLDLEWVAPPTCPQGDAIESRLRQLLPEVGGRELAIRGAVVVTPSGDWVAALSLTGPRGVSERSFASSDCATLAEAVALVLAVNIDPVATALALAELPGVGDEVTPAHDDQRERQPDPPKPAVQAHDDGPVDLDDQREPQQDAPTPTDSDDDEGDSGGDESRTTSAPSIAADLRDIDESVRPKAARPRRRSIATTHVSLAALGGGGYGPLDLASAQLGAALAVFGPRWRWDLRGLWLIPRTVAVASGRAGRVNGFALATRGCGVPELGPLVIPICAGVEAGALRGRGVDPTPNPRTAWQPLAAVVAGAGLRWSAHARVALGVDVELLASLMRGGFAILDEIAARYAPVGVRGLVALEIRLDKFSRGRRSPR